jgi:hypothetical protein
MIRTTALIILLGLCLAGCSKKDEAQEEKPKKITEICIGGTFSPNPLPKSYQTLLEEKEKKYFAKEHLGDENKWKEVPYESMNACLKGGFQPYGELVPIAPRPNERGTAVMMFVKYEE